MKTRNVVITITTQNTTNPDHTLALVREASILAQACIVRTEGIDCQITFPTGNIALTVAPDE